MRYFITADVHGSYNTWMTIRELMAPKDCLVVAGDLFDTRYGHFGHPDFTPDYIKRDIPGLARPLFYVYGNCDVSTYFPGYDHLLSFTTEAGTVFLHHGHRNPAIPENADIIIQGHTHLCSLEKTAGQIFLNPGSMTCPRNGLASYATMDETGIRILALRTGEPVTELLF